MKPASREILFGFFFSILSIGIVFGSASLSLMERQSQPAIPITENREASMAPVEEEITIPQNIGLPTVISTYIESSPSPTRCAVPQNWIAYEVRNGDSLELLAAAINVSIQFLKEANCLISDSLIPGSIIFLPSEVPTITITVAATAELVACPLPHNWTEHILQPDENLLILSQKYHVRIADLINANCFQNATILRAGDTIFLPYPEIATSTPYPVSVTNAPTMQSNQSIVSVTPLQPGSATTETNH